MSTPYTGNSSGLTARTDAIVTTEPADGDDLVASSATPADKKLADFMKLIQDKAAFINLANVFAALQDFTLGARGGVATQLPLPEGANVATGKAIGLTGTAKITSASNPVSTQAILNELHAKNMQKCWGTLTFNHTLGPSVADGCNIASVQVAPTGDFHIVKVNFAQAMANANYGIKWGATGVSSGAAIIHGVDLVKAAGNFTFKAYVLDPTGPTAAFVDFSAVGSDFNLSFSVDGTQ